MFPFEIQSGGAERAFRIRRNCRAMLSLAAWIICLVSADRGRAQEWDPVDQADLAAKKSVNFPDADAEILLSSHKYTDECTKAAMQEAPQNVYFQSIVDNFVRAKIYTEKGVQQQNLFLIHYPDGYRITGLEARVVKPSGATVELKKADFIESMLAQDEEGNALNQVAFVFPGLEAGDIIEYQWRELGDRYYRLIYDYVQSEFPIREYRYYLKEMVNGGALWWQNCPNVSTENKHGFTMTSRNIPAFEKEEHMPPMKELRGWRYITRSPTEYHRDAEMWPLLSHHWEADFDYATTPRDIVKRKAESLEEGATSDDEKLRRIYEFCQNNIVNVDYMLTAKLRAFADVHREDEALAPAKVLAAGRGRSDEVNYLFGALARAAGFEAREVRNPSNTVFTNIKIARAWAFFVNSSVALKVAGKWRFFDPGNFLVPFGLTDWRAENATALLCDLRKVEFAEIPTSTAEQNHQQYHARLVLDSEGTLDGDIEQNTTGQLAATQKFDMWNKSDEEVGKRFREEVAKRLPNAEVTQIVWTNLHVATVPLKVSCHVRVPGYAQQAGTRLIVPPSFFRVGQPIVFTAAERKHPIFFPYPWSEHDDVELVLPEGFVLDKPSAPSPVGDRAGVLGSAYSLRFNPKTRTLAYQRDFALGANGACRFKKESYPALKELFGRLHESDNHVLVLKSVRPAASAEKKPESEAAAPAHQP